MFTTKHSEEGVEEYKPKYLWMNIDHFSALQLFYS